MVPRGKRDSQLDQSTGSTLIGQKNLKQWPPTTPSDHGSGYRQGSKNIDDLQIKDCLNQLKCHFTWDLVVEDTDIPDLERRIMDEIDFLDTKSNVGIHNFLAYVRHLRGQNDKALQSLREAEDLISDFKDIPYRSDLRSLVTWSNYAWLYYHMEKLQDAQFYLDRVRYTCNTYFSPFRYRMECPEMDCEEGWALLKCGEQNYERAKACFEKALAAEPENPEFNIGYAITIYRQDYDRTSVISLEPLRKAIRLNPRDMYIKALLALKLQDIGQEAEGEKYIEEALSQTSSLTYIFRYAGKFYRKKGSVDKALDFFKKALQATPYSAFLHHQVGLCYRAKMIQIKKATNWQLSRQNREIVNRWAQLALKEFQTTLDIRPTFKIYVSLAEMYVEIGQYRQAEEFYQKALCMNNIEAHKQQQIHYYYGRFQQFHIKSEDKAIAQYLKGLKIEAVSYFRSKILSALENLARGRISRNVHLMESFSLLGLVHKLQGRVDEALQCYERALRFTAELNPWF
ncbi:interferon-induced protein with tetratricopeptide repeats 1B-like [Ctenodactylus gundi]